MKLSYWEIKSWLSYIDYTVVGSGIVGLNCALKLKQKYPKAKILILERGILPQGASTKNAGFACFGSISEILEDLNSHSESEVFDLVKKRKKGLDFLRNHLTDISIDYRQYGGYELFDNSNDELYEQCLSNVDTINSLLKPLFPKDVFILKPNLFQFNNIKQNYVYNQFEGQLDTGKMVETLLFKVHSEDIKILNNVSVEEFSEINDGVSIKTNRFDFISKKVFIATNGFAKQLLNEEVKPARAQVLITKPIENLNINGTFHLDRGYFYFRNIDNRILFGGGRNLDFKGEETTVMAETKQVQNKLEELLKTTILPNNYFEIEQRWSGVMGVGNQKKPIIKQIGNHIFCGVRLGGMGVAIGSSVGIDLANLLE